MRERRATYPASAFDPWLASSLVPPSTNWLGGRMADRRFGRRRRETRLAQSSVPTGLQRSYACSPNFMPMPSVIEVAQRWQRASPLFHGGVIVPSWRVARTVAEMQGPDWENALGHPSRTFLFHLEPDKGTTLQAQLRRMLVSAILD